MAEPSADPLDRRYARQRLLPEVGAAGQARLCEHRVAVSGDARAASVAAGYLERAGVDAALDEGRVTRGARAEVFTSSSPRPPLRLSSEQVASVAGRAELSEAAAWLAGAFAAVEEVKRALDVGAPGSLDGVRLTGAVPRERGEP